MRVLVTGSSGYLASLVLPRIAALPEVEALYGIDVRQPPSPPSGFEHINGTVLDPGLSAVFKKERIDLVLHLAWVFNPTHDAGAMREIDVEGTRNVAQAAAAAGVAHFIHVSSTTAYGAHPDNPPLLAESAPVRGTAAFPYSADKAAAEAVLAELLPRHPQLSWTILRPCIVLGARTDNFVRAILALPLLVRIIGRDPELQFLHEQDVADALIWLVQNRPRGIYNLAPAESVRMSEIGRITGKFMLPLPSVVAHALVGLLWRMRLFRAPSAYLDFIEWQWLADGTKLTRERGCAPRHTSRDAVRATRGH